MHAIVNLTLAPIVQKERNSQFRDWSGMKISSVFEVVAILAHFFPRRSFSAASSLEIFSVILTASFAKSLQVYRQKNISSACNWAKGREFNFSAPDGRNFYCCTKKNQRLMNAVYVTGQFKSKQPFCRILVRWEEKNKFLFRRRWIFSQ